MIEQDYLAYKDEIVAYLYKFVGSEAEDIVQTAFLEMLTKQITENSRALFFTVAKRRARDYLRDNHAEVVDPTNLEAVLLEDDFESEELTDAIARLSDSEASLIRMAYWEGLNHIAIGERIGCTHVYARQKVSRAVKKLRKLLSHSQNHCHTL